ncbi:MAG: hypothetical protein AAF512_04685 [Pseudomonadota bacterium]
MKNQWVLTLSLALITISTTPVTWAETSQTTQSAQLAQLQEHFEKTKTRLKLTDTQVEQVRPILQESFQAQKAVLDKYGIDLNNRENNKKLGLRGARALRKELDAARNDIVEKLGTILNTEQLAEYQKMQAERRKEMRKRIQRQR